MQLVMPNALRKQGCARYALQPERLPIAALYQAPSKINLFDVTFGWSAQTALMMTSMQFSILGWAKTFEARHCVDIITL
jgi:hypothetical protein